jgi:hypothetical protein
VYYDGPITTSDAPATTKPGAAAPSAQGTPSGQGTPMPIPEETSILEENWDAPKPAPQPSRPMHNARQSQGGQLGRTMPRPASQPRVAARNLSPSGRPVGGGVSRASY